MLIWNICLQKRWFQVERKYECMHCNYATAFLIRLAVSTWFSLKHSLHHLVQRANRWFLWPKSSLLWIGARDQWNSWKKGFNHSDALSFGFNLVNIGGAYVCHPRINFTAGAGTLRFEVTHVSPIPHSLKLGTTQASNSIMHLLVKRFYAHTTFLILCWTTVVYGPWVGGGVKQEDNS